MAVEAFAGTVTEAGTLKDPSLLERLTAKPPVAAAAFKVTVQTSVADPVIVAAAQEMPVNSGVPVPLILMTVLGAAREVLVMVTSPAVAPE